ncbi:hypothetical protein [Streptomyces oceani]|uniref:Excalibur calcium-binding domain-containing protein n=1 Tax=Streptomyces oceani TaxID=1075402 RepID=A0A1E7JWA2_9ACTN|nr:hypothetical protein [Streptomyces oceani]OEU95767.1 hypothetical protein AN216_23325 [Streptomyces oceani]
MRFRIAVATGAIAAVAPLTMAGAAVAAPGAPAAPAEKDCKDYDSQKAAQQAFDSDTSDPNRLDHDKDKKACEKWPPGKGNPANADEGEGEDGATAPDGSVDAGGGGTAQDPADVALPLGIAAGASLAAAGGVLVVRRHRADSES